MTEISYYISIIQIAMTNKGIFNTSYNRFSA